MNKLAIAALCGIALAGLAPAQETAASAPTDAAALQSTAAQPAIDQVLTEPDGVAIGLKDDGSFQIFARGSGVYDVDDPSELAAARTEATLNAKANLAKFIKEKVAVAEAVNDVVKKTKTIEGNGQVQTKIASTEEVKTMSKTIATSAEQVVQGVITLREQKAPGAGTGGQIQVTVGISSKTIEAVRRLTGQKQTEMEKNNQDAPVQPAAAPVNNQGYIHNATTDF